MMAIIKSRFRISLVTLVLTFALASCNPSIQVKIEEYGAGVKIKFGKTEFFSQKLEKVCITHIQLVNVTKDQEAWRVDSRNGQCLSSNNLSLGSVPDGFFETTKMKKLVKGDNYVASVTAEEGSGVSDVWQF